MFLVAFIGAFGWSRAESSIAFAVSQFMSGISAPLVGAMVDRLGPRRMILIGGVLLAVGLFGNAHAGTLWQVILLYGVVMTLGANCLGLVVFVPTLSRLFVRKRGMAVLIVQSANGFARAYTAPLSPVLISGIGWRDTYLVQGSALLYERFLDRPFAGHRDSVSELAGDALESAIERQLIRWGVSHYKTKRAEKVPGFKQAPDFIIPSWNNPEIIIEAKISEDDGTARDKSPASSIW